MICNQCGAQLPEGTTVCPNCGAALNAQPQYQQPFQAQPVMAQPATLIWGILSLALCWVPVIGIIFAILGRSKGKAFVRAGGVLTGASKVGFILCIPGLILSIFWNVYWLIIFIIALAAA